MCIRDRTGSLFQEHLQRNRIENEEYLKQLILYVHLNPLKHQFSKDFQLYRHSSYRSFLSDKSSSIDREFIIKLFNDLENFIFCHDERKLIYEGVLIDVNLLDQ